MGQMVKTFLALVAAQCILQIGAFNGYAGRKFEGTKVMKIALLPVIFAAMDVFLVVFMVTKLNIRQNHVTKLCVGAIAMSVPLLFSTKAHFGIYSGFLALLVSFMSNTNIYPRWMYRIVWAMLFFQIVLIFGPTEAFHVPLFNQSMAGANADLMSTLLAQTGKDCDTHFNSFFALIKQEKEQFYANPDREYYGYCDEAFIAFVQATLMVQGLIWMATVLVAAPVFLPANPDSGGIAQKVAPSPVVAFDDGKAAAADDQAAAKVEEPAAAKADDQATPLVEDYQRQASPVDDTANAASTVKAE